MKPLLFGYQAVRLGTTRAQLVAGRDALVAFARAEGYALGEVFVEHDVNRPTSALVALIAASQAGEVKAIAVPSLSDLGRIPRVQQMTRRRLEREAAVPVLVVVP